MIRDYYFALDPGGAGGVVCKFVNSTDVSFGASFYEERMNIEGAAGATVSVQIIQFINTNDDPLTVGNGLFVNNLRRDLNFIFTVTLDGTGNGSFLAKVKGNPVNTGTVMLGKFQIIGVSTGTIGSPNTKQISKTF